MRRDPGYSAALDVKRNEKADRDPGGQDRGQGHLHHGFQISPADFLAPVLDLNPHPTLLDLPSETTAYRPPAIDQASSQEAHEIALAAQAYINLNLQFLMYRAWRGFRAGFTHQRSKVERYARSGNFRASSALT